MREGAPTLLEAVALLGSLLDRGASGSRSPETYRAAKMKIVQTIDILADRKSSILLRAAPAIITTILEG